MKITQWGDREWWSLVDNVHVDREVEHRGAQQKDILDWVTTIRVVQSWALHNRVVTRWPPCFIYCTMSDAISHHVREPYADRILQANDPMALRCMAGAALFESHSNIGHPDAPCIGDRTLLAAAAMGGDTPLLSTILHELGHHHLWQVYHIPQSQQTSTPIELAIDKLVHDWSPELRGMVPSSNSAIFRLIDIASPGDM